MNAEGKRGSLSRKHVYARQRSNFGKVGRVVGQGRKYQRNNKLSVVGHSLVVSHSWPTSGLPWLAADWLIYPGAQLDPPQQAIISLRVTVNQRPSAPPYTAEIGGVPSSRSLG